MHPTLEYLENKNLLWRANNGLSRGSNAVQYTGYKELDNALQGGFPEHGVIDVITPIGIGELRLFIPSLLAKQQQNNTALITFISPPLSINSEMFAEYGFDLNNILTVAPNSASDGLWSAEQCLKSGSCHSVILWHNQLSIAQIKRLQIAAEKGNALLLIMRQSKQEQLSLPVTLGVSLSPAKSGIQAHITKRKGAWPSQPFTINMQSYWPELSTAESAKVINFPSHIHQAG